MIFDNSLANSVFMRFIPNMETQNINPISFNGIKLSTYGDRPAKRVVRYMEVNGYGCVGKKTYHVNNKLEDKSKIASYIREHFKFYENEFGILFFPWSREVYLLSELENEQKMLEWVREMDPKACINLMI